MSGGIEVAEPSAGTAVSRKPSKIGAALIHLLAPSPCSQGEGKKNHIAPIHMAIETMKVLIESSDTTS